MLRALAVTPRDEIESCVSFNECVASGKAQLKTQRQNRIKYSLKLPD